jgi:glycine/D-amino acid oxidase-like deaminating enzyme
MGEVSEAAKRKAAELFNACGSPYRLITVDDVDRDRRALALAEYIQAVSDAAKGLVDQLSWSSHAQADADNHLAPFILPEPDDPFVECIKLILGGFEGERHAREYADSLRKAMAKRGLRIVEATPSDNTGSTASPEASSTRSPAGDGGQGDA